MTESFPDNQTYIETISKKATNGDFIGDNFSFSLMAVKLYEKSDAFDEDLTGVCDDIILLSSETAAKEDTYTRNARLHKMKELYSPIFKAAIEYFYEQIAPDTGPSIIRTTEGIVVKERTSFDDDFLESIELLGYDTDIQEEELLKLQATYTKANIHIKNGFREYKKEIMTARADFFKAVLCYSDKDIDDLLNISGEDKRLPLPSNMLAIIHIAHTEFGASNPVKMFARNRKTLFMTPEYFRNVTKEVVARTGVKPADLVQKASKVYTRYIRTKDELIELMEWLKDRDMLDIVRQCPEILEYSKPAIIGREKAYEAMGISIDQLKSNKRLYLTKPESLQKKLRLIGFASERLGVASEPLVNGFLERPNALRSMGNDKIKTIVRLIARGSVNNGFQDTLDQISLQKKVTNPYSALLRMFTDCCLEDLQKAVNDGEDIFLAVRRIKNSNQSTRRYEKLEK